MAKSFSRGKKEKKSGVTAVTIHSRKSAMPTADDVLPSVFRILVDVVGHEEEKTAKFCLFLKKEEHR